MLQPIQVPIMVPAGAAVEVVDDEHPLLEQFPLVIEGSIGMSADAIYRKLSHYRFWHKLCAIKQDPRLFPEADEYQIVDVVQSLYLQHDDQSEYYKGIKGIDSVGIIFTKTEESHVIEQLSDLPAALPWLASSPGASGPTRVLNHSGHKSVRVQDLNGITKSLLLLEQLLDIEVPKPNIFIFLNNSSHPSWNVAIPKDGPAMYAFGRPLVLNEKESKETAAWEYIKEWLKRFGVPVKPAQQYPEGENHYPDFRAWIGNQEYDIEMTSVPDMSKWTIRANSRDLEKKISEVAAQPGEKLEEVIGKLHEVLDKKAKVARASASPRAEHGRRSMLVITNWSTYRLSDEAFCPREKMDAFDVVLLIDIDEVRCIKWEITDGVSIAS